MCQWPLGLGGRGYCIEHRNSSAPLPRSEWEWGLLTSELSLGQYHLGDGGETGLAAWPELLVLINKVLLSRFFFYWLPFHKLATLSAICNTDEF